VLRSVLSAVSAQPEEMRRTIVAEISTLTATIERKQQ
jgi:hypothetical protein